MKITKSLQRQYLRLLLDSKVEEFNVLSEGKEKFTPMYLVSHGFLNAEAALSFKEEVIKNTGSKWDLVYEYKEKTFFIWLMDLQLKTGIYQYENVLLWFLRYAFEFLGDRSYDYFVKLLIKHGASRLWRMNYKGYLTQIPPKILEANGENAFIWNLKYGASLERIQEIYKPGDEFLKDSKGNKVLCFLPDSKQELREFFFKHTQIASDPEFTSLGIDIKDNYYLSRPYQSLMFPLNGDLKQSMGVNSRLIVETLKNNCTFALAPHSEAKELTLDYFNAVYIIKNKLPQIDENVLHNALLEVVNRNVKHLALNTESLEDIIDLTWNELKFYSEKRRIKMLLSNYSSLSSIRDTMAMLQSKAATARELNLKLLPDKPKSFMDIHNHLQRIPELLETNQELNQEFSPTLSNYTLGELEMIFPQTENDMILIGVELNICVGSEHYREAVVAKTSQVFTIRERGVLKACVEVKYLASSQGMHVSVEQISGFQNKAVEPKFNDFIFKAFQDKMPEARLSFPYRLPNEQDYNYE